MTATTGRVGFSKRSFFRSSGDDPHPGQAAFHECTATSRVLACGVRWGKSLCAAAEALAGAMEPRDRCISWVVAPTYDLADKIYRETTYIASRHLQRFVIAIRESEKRLILRNMAG